MSQRSEVFSERNESNKLLLKSLKTFKWVIILTIAYEAGNSFDLTLYNHLLSPEAACGQCWKDGFIFWPILTDLY